MSSIFLTTSDVQVLKWFLTASGLPQLSSVSDLILWLYFTVLTQLTIIRRNLTFVRPTFQLLREVLLLFQILIFFRFYHAVRWNIHVSDILGHLIYFFFLFPTIKLCFLLQLSCHLETIFLIS